MNQFEFYTDLNSIVLGERQIRPALEVLISIGSVIRSSINVCE